MLFKARGAREKLDFPFIATRKKSLNRWNSRKLRFKVPIGRILHLKGMNLGVFGELASCNIIRTILTCLCLVSPHRGYKGKLRDHTNIQQSYP